MHHWRFRSEAQQLWVIDASFYAEHPTPHRDSPLVTQWPELLAGKLRQAGLAHSRIGLDGPISTRVCELLPKLTTCDLSFKCRALRFVKHSEEIAVMRAAAALADMDRFVDMGITTFDCADIYTGVEALIGRWLKRRGARGAAVPVQVHTKYVPDLDRLPAHSRADVVRGVDRSRARLGVDSLDLVQLHWWDYDVPGYVEAAAWLDELRRAGRIRHVGLTNFDQKRLKEIVAAGIPVVSHQVQYSVLDRRPANGIAAQCARDGIGVLCYGALAGVYCTATIWGNV